ncbi:T9SS type A sorting domain-containing protein [Frigoriflavimonas asaccharolytica]|uniref:Secretion system C-terminal sorting domain-containing protein n=1 Tax=Frigoriflavimonas asaccharolytica TaxID=2735899 RepID=A0A8J8G6P4_9FLAO|nr:T9SS type A sorting domain-containing protein [Frigoriflavimonas asaccharolytica]NRS92001.1 hypothetical protein [Frigoriflavimonas asaccharolytica]
MKKLLLIAFVYASTMIFSTDFKSQSVQESSSISQNTDDGILIAYPNPVKTSIFIKTKDNSTKIKTVAFYSILGTQVASYNLNTSSAELNLEKLRPGKYLMRYILSDNTSKIKQIIKQ